MGRDRTGRIDTAQNCRTSSSNMRRSTLGACPVGMAHVPSTSIWLQRYAGNKEDRERDHLLAARNTPFMGPPHPTRQGQKKTVSAISMHPSTCRHCLRRAQTARTRPTVRMEAVHAPRCDPEENACSAPGASHTTRSPRPGPPWPT